ncbi:MAG: CHASE2 domain-containing protein, partial [Bdellovibrionales bacterium]|nr:CHASE2 domain-containing protein [Bdellovibrionales bacterium]
LLNEAKLINFQGPQGTYKRISFNKILNNQVDTKELKNKIIIVGTKQNEQHTFQTPLGPMTRSEVIANITDNFLNQQWIQKLPNYFNIFILIVVLVVGMYIIHNYPHSMTFIFLTWLSLTYSAFSLWIFDQFYLWIPLLAPIAQLIGAFVIFLSYQLTEKDYQNWKLEQEKIYLFKVEKMKDNFISLFSHDLKTPIAKIQAICDRLITDNPTNQLMSDLELLRRESQKLHKYIQSILQITRVESKDFKINKDSYDINEIIKEAFERLKVLFIAKGQKVELDLEPLFLIEIDGQLVREVIINLLENASKYSPAGSTIQVSSHEDENGVYFVVKDQGPGINKQEVEKVFEKFYRGKDQLNKTKGSGLGLYLAKYFIELHGGKLNFKSDLGKGSEVSFCLPV